MARSLTSALLVLLPILGSCTTARAVQPSRPIISSPDPNYVIDAAFTRDAFPPGTPGLTPPLVIREVRPTYTPGGMRAGIEGEVGLKLRVGVYGKVEGVRVVKSLNRSYGLDEEALRAARQHLYRPATLNGQPVATLLDLPLYFNLY